MSQIQYSGTTEKVCGGCELLWIDRVSQALRLHTLVDHPVVEHLDMDAAVLKSLEDLFDSMLEGSVV